MMLHLDSVEHDLANKGVWVTTRFLLLTSELCVVAFGSAFGVREDRVSVSGRWSTFSIASISSVTRSAFKGSRWFVRQSPSWSALSRLTLKSFSHFTGSRFIAFLQYFILHPDFLCRSRMVSIYMGKGVQYFWLSLPVCWYIMLLHYIYVCNKKRNIY